MTTPSPALTATAEAILAVLNADPYLVGFGQQKLAEVAAQAASAALEAATPHILAAAGKVITEDQAADIMRDTMARGMRAVFGAELDRVEAAARAAERERIAELAEHHRASYPVRFRGEDGFLGIGEKPFAALIREQP